jgi:Fe-S-cluster containining protein
MSNETENFTKYFTKKVNGLFIDPKIFTYKFSCECTGECCHYGVYTDLKEHDKILEIKDRILPFFDESQSTMIDKWFEPPEEDEDFESGIVVGTEVIKGKCTFLDKNGLCVLQKLALHEGEHKWKYKPLYCILFPLTIYEGTLTIDDEHIDRLKTCNVKPDVRTSVFEFCKQELRYFLGEKSFAELKQYGKEYLSGIQLGVEENAEK